MRKKAEMTFVQIVAAVLAVVSIVIGLYFGGDLLLRRGGGAVQDQFVRFEDADGDGIKNLEDECCPAICRPQRVEDIEQFGKYKGCTPQQGKTLCEFTGPQCNPRAPLVG